MKIIALLPDSKHFRAIESPKAGRFLFEDKASPLLRIDTPDNRPWSQKWKILLGIKKGATRAGIEYPQALILRCFPLDDEILVEAVIERERWKGKFAYSLAPTLFFAAIPCLEQSNWLMISVYER